MRYLIGGILLLIIAPTAFLQEEKKQEQEYPPDNIEVASESILREFNDYIDQKDWEGLVEFYAYLTEEPEAKIHLKRFYPDPDPNSDKWSYVSFPEYIVKLFSKLPKQAIDKFRSKFDHKVGPHARDKDKWDIAFMEKLLERYFFTSYSDEIMLVLANYYLEQGNIQRASTHFRNLLNYTYGDVMRKNVIVKLALCYKLMGKNKLITSLKKYQDVMDEIISVGGKEYTVEKFLEGIPELTV